MPCYDPRPNEAKIIYEEVGVPEEQWNVLVDEYNKKEAILCALYNELIRRDILKGVIESAEKNGEIDIMSDYKEHRKADILRLKTKMEEYSKDELDLLREILNMED